MNLRVSAVLFLVLVSAASAADAPASSWWSLVTGSDTVRATMLSTIQGQLGPGSKLGDIEIVQAYPPIVNVKNLELALTPDAAGPRLLVATGRLVITPASGTSPATAVLTAPAASLTAPKAITVHDFTAKVASGPAGLIVQHFDAKAYGGKVSGSVTPVKGAAAQMALNLTSLSLGEITGRKGGERLTANLTGSLPARIEDCNATGRATLSGMSTNLANDATLRSMDAKAARGQRTAKMMGAFIQDDALSGIAQSLSGAGQATYYRNVIAGLRRRHDLGSAGGPLKISKGVATIAPFTGSKLGGKVTMNLATTALSGYLSRVRLGRVTLLSVSISGTAGNPGYSVNQNKILVDGRRPSAGSNKLPEGLPRAVIGNVLGGAMRRRSGGGGNLLRGLLGGF